MSKIEWTGRTWNPATGCTKISPGCDHCYMHRLYPRLRAMTVNGYQDDPDTVRVWPVRLKDPFQWPKNQIVFTCSMSDFFHQDIPPQFIDQALDVMSQTAARGHVFQILTKRSARARQYWKDRDQRTDSPGVWPENVMLGVSVETQKFAGRIDHIQEIPATWKFISAEPLLGPIDIEKQLSRGAAQWVIAGGESGPGARPMKEEWVRDLLEQCQRQSVPFFLKQLGGAKDKRGGGKALLDGKEWKELPEILKLKMKDRTGTE